MRMHKVVGPTLAVLLAGTSLAFAAPAQIGTQMQPFTLEDIESKPMTIELNKKVNLVSFWVSSCSLCKEELRVLNALGEKYKGNKDIGITVVSTDFGGPRMVKIVLKESGGVVNVPIVFDKGLNVARDKFGVTSFPALFLLDKAGKIDFFMEGYQADSEARINSEIEWRLKKE